MPWDESTLVVLGFRVFKSLKCERDHLGSMNPCSVFKSLKCEHLGLWRAMVDKI